MIVLGIDPAIGASKSAAPLGIAVIDTSRQLAIDAAALRFPDMSLPARLGHVIEHVIRRLDAHRPALVAIEDAHLRLNARTMKELAYVIGACIAVCDMTPVQLVQPSAAKEALTGNGKADKQQMRSLAAALWGFPPGLNQADQSAIADAIGVALAGETLASKQELANG